VTFPFKERFKIFKSLAFELEDDLPFDQYETFYDAKIRRFVGNSSEVIASAIPKYRIEKLYQSVKDSGLNVTHIVPNSLSLYNMFSAFNQAPPSFKESDVDTSIDELNEDGSQTQDTPLFAAQAIIELGQSSSSLIVKTDTFLVETRFIDWGLKDAASAYASKNSMQFNESLQEILANGEILINDQIAAREKQAISDALISSLDNLMRPLRFHFLEIEKHNSVNISQIFITGGASLIKNIAPYLTQKLELPVEPTQFLVKNPRALVNHNEYDGRTSGVALGLALEGLKTNTNPASNFLQGDFAPASEGFAKTWERWSYAAYLLIACFVIFFTYSMLRHSFSKSMADEAHKEMKTQIEAVMGIKGRKATQRQARKFIAEQENIMKQTQLTKNLTQLNSSLDVLNALSQSSPSRKPSNYEVKRLIIENSTVTVEGEARSTSAIRQLQNGYSSLSNTQSVKTIRTGYNARAGWRPFGFSFTVDRKAKL